jgi:hypothetical protein
VNASLHHKKESRPGYSGEFQQITVEVPDLIYNGLLERKLATTWQIIVQDALEVFGDTVHVPDDEEFAKTKPAVESYSDGCGYFWTGTAFHRPGG